jgi:hypothetical protein
MDGSLPEFSLSIATISASLREALGPGEELKLKAVTCTPKKHHLHYLTT